MSAKYSIAPFDFYPREKISPSYFSKYRKFFRGAKWDLFAVPSDCGPSFNERIDSSNSKLLEIPAVYEFAVSLSPTGGKRYKVYLGQTVNMKQRHGQYIDSNIVLKPANHIYHLMKTSLDNGLFIHRRIRYIVPHANLTEITRAKADLMGLMWETRLLGSYNYAWNTKNNGQSHQKIDHTRVAKKVNFLCLFSKVKFEYNDPNARNFYKI